MYIEQFISAIVNNLACQNGADLAKNFSLLDNHAQDKSLTPYNPEKMKMGKQYFPWREMIVSHIHVLTLLYKNDVKGALEMQFKLIDAFSELFDIVKEDNWFLPVMYSVVVDLRCLARAVDYGVDAEGKTHQSGTGENMKKVSDMLMRLYRKCVSDTRTNIDNSKKMGMMTLSNQLFKIFFAINQLNLCKPLIMAIENLKIIDKFSVSQRVTYYYYVGRKAMFEDSFEKANESLTFAFENCHRNYVGNKRLILINLIPVRMLLGVFPDPKLLQKYNLSEFGGVVNSVKRGDLHQLDEELKQHGSFFISCGVYLILEKLKYIAYRNLFKVVTHIAGSHMVPIKAFADALQHVGVADVDDDETECIIANLIFENKIKGYIAHQQKKLVMSKTNAFPSISQCTVTVTR